MMRVLLYAAERLVVHVPVRRVLQIVIEVEVVALEHITTITYRIRTRKTSIDTVTCTIFFFSRPR